jgi:hypothetical protein
VTVIVPPAVTVNVLTALPADVPLAPAVAVSVTVPIVAVPADFVTVNGSPAPSSVCEQTDTTSFVATVTEPNARDAGVCQTINPALTVVIATQMIPDSADSSE